MDLCAVHVKNLFHTNSFCHRPISSNLGRTGISFRVVDGRVFEITILRRKSYCKGYRPFVVSAAGKKNHDNSSSSVMEYFTIYTLFNCHNMNHKQFTTNVDGEFHRPCPHFQIAITRELETRMVLWTMITSFNASLELRSSSTKSMNSLL